jgi:predicted ATPase
MGPGRIEEAQRLLTSVYGQFAEALNTKDLQAARGLLDRLSSCH